MPTPLTTNLPRQWKSIPYRLKRPGTSTRMSPKVMFLCYMSLIGALQAPASSRYTLALVLPLALAIVALQVLVLAAIAIILASLVLLTAAAALVFTPAVAIADQPGPTIV